MKKLLIIGGSSLLLILGILFGAFYAGPLLASAQSTSTATTTPTKTNPYCTQHLNDLAKRLGVSVDTLKQDQTGAREDVLAQQVKDGKLTQQRADKIKQRVTSHQACTNNGKGHLGGKVGFAKKYLVGAEAQIAQGLHLTTDQLTAQLKAGKSLNDIATAQKVSSDQLKTTVTNALQSALKQAVSAGNITQAQADKLTKGLQTHPQMLDKLLNRHFSTRFFNQQ